MQPPQLYTARLEDKIELNSKFVHYFFELENPHTLNFQAGQYTSIKVDEKGQRRSYSFCSSPGITHGFELMVDVTPGGIGVQFLQNLAFGQQISAMAPMGRFVLAEDTTNDIVFVATGSGVAPFRSMILDLLQEHQDQRNITLYWGLRHVEDLAWQDEFQELSKYFPNFRFNPVISQAPPEWPMSRGRVTDVLAVHETPTNAHFYLCGNKPMIEDVKNLLLSKNVDLSNIHHELFY